MVPSEQGPTQSLPRLRRGLAAKSPPDSLLIARASRSRGHGRPRHPNLPYRHLSYLRKARRDSLEQGRGRDGALSLTLICNPRRANHPYTNVWSTFLRFASWGKIKNNLEFTLSRKGIKLRLNGKSPVQCRALFQSKSAS